MKFELEYVLKCCERRYSYIRSSRVRKPFSVNGYTHPSDDGAVARKYGTCSECGKKRPQANIRMRIEG